MDYSDLVPAPRLAHQLGVRYPNPIIDLLLGAFDDIITFCTPEEVAASDRRRDRLRMRFILRRLRRTDSNLAPAERRLRVQAEMSKSRRAVSVRQQLMNDEAARAVLRVQVLHIATRDAASDRTRRIAGVAAAGLMLISASFRESHGGVIERLAAQPPFAPDLTAFLLWIGSGDPVPDAEQQLTAALGIARGREAADAALVPGIEPEWPAAGTHNWEVLRALLSAEEQVYVPSHALPGKNPRSSVSRLRGLGWQVETARRGDADQGWRLAPAHAHHRANFAASGPPCPRG